MKEQYSVVMLRKGMDEHSHPILCENAPTIHEAELTVKHFECVMMQFNERNPVIDYQIQVLNPRGEEVWV